MSTYVPYGDRSVTLEFGSGYAISDYRTCPICLRECENRGDDGDREWHASGLYLGDAGEGPNGVWYCSDSCRSQAMFQTLTAEQQAAMKELVYSLSRLVALAKQIGMSYDHDLCQWEVPIEHPLYAWGFNEFKLRALLKAGDAAYHNLHGSADIEQPTWMYDAEEGE